MMRSTETVAMAKVRRAVRLHRQSGYDAGSRAALGASSNVVGMMKQERTRRERLLKNGFSGLNPHPFRRKRTGDCAARRRVA